MKKIFLLATAAMLLGTSLSYATDGDKDKKKSKQKTEKTEKKCPKTCNKNKSDKA